MDVFPFLSKCDSITCYLLLLSPNVLNGQILDDGVQAPVLATGPDRSMISEFHRVPLQVNICEY